MRLLRSERAAAFLLLAAAALGLLAANSPFGPALMELQDAHLAIPGTPLDLSVGHWISDGLLAVFFFVVAVELKNELTVGQLNSVSKAIRPAVAAFGGVVVPALIYVAVTWGSGYERGWPIPTATDIAFALGILAVFGKGIPSRLRIFMLALAILDDIVAIVIIAVFFTQEPNLLLLGLAAVARAGVRRAQPDARVEVARAGRYRDGARRPAHLEPRLHLRGARDPRRRRSRPRDGTASGDARATRTGAGDERRDPAAVRLLGCAGRDSGGRRSRSSPHRSGAILIALPVGKLIGIALGGWLSTFLGPKDARPHLTFYGLATAGALGGIGFTVSLLMNELAFARTPEVADEGTLAVLLGSSISIVVAAIMVSRLAAYYRRLQRLRRAAERRIGRDPAME